MDQSLLEVWEGAAGNPFIPLISKDNQFSAGISLLALGILLSGYFGLNRSFINLPLVGVPAAFTIGFGAVLMICAVGVYV